MKIFLVLDETSFYHPSFTNALIDKLKFRKYEVKVGLVTKIDRKNSIEKFLIKNIFKLHLKEIILLGIKKILFAIANTLLNLKNHFFSVEAVLVNKNIDYIKIKNNINTQRYIDHIRKFKPDIIISSCSLIFGQDILRTPKIACINRHSALLPAYGGVWPVLQSIADGNEFSGVSVHKMTEKIDEGKILSQIKVKNTENNLSKIYKKCFEVSSDLVLLAIDNLIEGKFVTNSYKKSYYSFPSNERWDLFRKNKGKFI